MSLAYEPVRGTKVANAGQESRFLLRAGTLFDGIGPEVRQNVDILVQNGRIAEVRPAGAFGVLDCPLEDYSDKFVMPGLIEAHLHLSGMHTQEPYRRYFENNDVRLIRALIHAEELLAHGYTTVREMGAKGRGVGIREGIAKGLCRGPRILTSIEFLSPTGGHGDWPILPYDFVKETSLRSILVDGPDECVRAVRYLLREGADVVKIVTATGNMGQPYDRMKFRACFSLREIRAMSDEAHEQGKKIAAHVVGDVGLRNALDGDIDTLEHCFFNYEQHPELLDRIIDKKVTLIPTLSIIKWFGEYEAQNGNQAAADRFYYNVEKHGAFVKAAWKAGVPIACGTDENGMHGVGRCPEEYVSLVEAGLPSYAVLQGATSVAAKTLDIADDTGVIQAGKRADILVLEKDPLKNIGILRDKGNITCVLQGK